MISSPSGRQFRFWLMAIVLASAALRFLFPAADPPWQSTVGIVWHDEGAWVHNARNRALFGSWSLDQWNPMFISPVFTALEYVSFALLGTGIRQARLVPEILGCLSVLTLGLGIAHVAGRRAGLVAAALVATNYVYVMWNRAALMESPMTAFMVASWYCYAKTTRSASWAWPAAIFALLAYFTKAAAAFFVAAIGVDAIATLALGTHSAAERAAARTTLAALVICGLVALALFVAPHWNDYWFYNVEMSVTRKPSYDVASVFNRLTWFPILHDLFTRMWLTLALAIAAALGMLVRFRQSSAGERLLVLWIGLGALELVAHDVGNERRFVFFIPPLIGLASLLLCRECRLLPARLAEVARARALVAAPLVGYVLYVLCGSAVRLAFLYEVRPNVRLGAALAAMATIAIYATWPRLTKASWLSWSPAAGLLLAAILCVGQIGQYVQWAVGRTYENYEASIALGRALAPGTLVQGKLANGLALENRIRPLFIGHGFGNFDDRKKREDVRYILTYIAPRVGYEGSQILDVLEAYPNRKIIMTFDVAETATGHDRAALIDKFGTAGSTHAQTTARANH